MKDLDPRITSIIYLVAMIVLAVTLLISTDTDMIKKVLFIGTVVFGVLAVIAYGIDIKKNPNRYK